MDRLIILLSAQGVVVVIVVVVVVVVIRSIILGTRELGLVVGVRWFVCWQR